MSSAPAFHIDVADFWNDPYPALARMRAEAPVAFVPELGATLLTRRDDIANMEKRVDVLSSDQPAGLMNRLMGQNMMRKDGAAHTAERNVYAPAIAPAAVAAVWRAEFRAHADRVLSALPDAAQADLIEAFALPLSAECLKSMTGLTNVRYEEMDDWSQAMIEGIANYVGNPEVERRCNEATAAIDAAIDDMLPVVRAKPNPSLLSVMLEAGMPEEHVRANVKLTISGGQNEPRKAIAGTVWALLTHPDQLVMVRRGDATWVHAFDELTRWISPIGMSPRRVAKPWTIDGVDLEPEDRVFLMFGSANRDETHFVDADRFDITRSTTKAIVFGAGPHFCAGAAAARSMVADVALPALFERWPDLRMDGDVRIGGWAFRGLLTMPVAWG
ncbi:MAG TPA: cytochrome P450 [Acidimicrobiales bacterium]|nr:cytochrome P450 [Acidimicrobiales bacterium]